MSENIGQQKVSNAIYFAMEVPFIRWDLSYPIIILALNYDFAENLAKSRF